MVSADPVVVVPYDEAWPSLYEEERARIERVIGPWVEEIEHVGSTAVPGLAAKPVIDIMVGVRSLKYSPILVERLVGIGYEYVPEFERVLPFRRYFRKIREGTVSDRCHDLDGHMRRRIEDNSGRMRLWLCLSGEEAS